MLCSTPTHSKTTIEEEMRRRAERVEMSGGETDQELEPAEKVSSFLLFRTLLFQSAQFRPLFKQFSVTVLANVVNKE